MVATTTALTKIGPLLALVAIGATTWGIATADNGTPPQTPSAPSAAMPSTPSCPRPVEIPSAAIATPDTSTGQVPPAPTEAAEPVTRVIPDQPATGDWPHHSVLTFTPPTVVDAGPEYRAGRTPAESYGTSESELRRCANDVLAGRENPAEILRQDDALCRCLAFHNR